MQPVAAAYTCKLSDVRHATWLPAGALFGILGGYVAYKVKNRHTMPLFSQDMMSIAGMLAFNFALMWMFNSVFDHW